MKAWNHAQSSARKWGGEPEDYLPVHEFIDSSKETFGDVRHRALLHSTWGIYLCEKIFGKVIEVPKRNGHGTKKVVVRDIAEQHIMEDLGRLPSPGDWLGNMEIQPWMGGRVKKAKQFSWQELGWKETSEASK